MEPLEQKEDTSILSRLDFLQKKVMELEKRLDEYRGLTEGQIKTIKHVIGMKNEYD